MRGTVIEYKARLGVGRLVGENGVRFRFHKDNFRAGDAPAVNAAVEFTANGAEAVQIALLPQGTVVQVAPSPPPPQPPPPKPAIATSPAAAPPQPPPPRAPAQTPTLSLAAPKIRAWFGANKRVVFAALAVLLVVIVGGLAWRELGAGNFEAAELAVAHGTAAMQQERYEDALAEFDRAISLKRNFALAHLSRGNANFALRDFDTARTDYAEAIRLDPDFPESYLARGMLEWTVGNPASAEQDFATLVQLQPESAFYAGRYATALYDQEKDQEVLDFYRRVFSENPERHWAAAGQLYAISAMRDGGPDGESARLAQAQQWWNEGRQFVEIQFAIGDANFALGNYDTAITWLGPLMSEDPNLIPTEAVMKLAAAYAHTYRPDACVEIFRNYADRMGRLAEFNLASTSRQCGATP